MDPVRARPRSREARCPYCREEVERDPVECPRCAARLHLECLGELTRCPSLGCGAKPHEFVDAAAEGRPAVAPGALQRQAAPAWRIALRRALLVGVVLATPMVALALAEPGQPEVGEVLVNFGVGLFAGLATVPMSLFEAWDGRRPPSLARHALAAAANAALSAAGGLGAWLLGETLFRLGRLGLGPALRRAWDGVVDQLVTRPFPGAALLALFTATLATTSFVRLRGRGLGGQLLATGGTVGALAAALWRVRPARGPSAFGLPDEEVAFLAIAAALVVVLPVALWLVESVRWRALLRRGGAAKA